MNPSLQIAEIARIADQLDLLCGDDERLFADMLEGETGLFEIVSRLHQQIASDGELVAGIAERQASLGERKARLSARVAASKAAVGKFLRAGMLSKIELSEATYSVRVGKPSLTVVDADAVPAEYTRTKVDPDKTAINEAFANETALPNWLVRNPASDVVTARTK